MAEKKEEKTVDELVEIRVPRGASNEEPCIMIGINGKNFLLPKGKTSKVPKYVAEEYKRHLEAVDNYSAKISGIQEEEQQINSAASAKLGK